MLYERFEVHHVGEYLTSIKGETEIVLLDLERVTLPDGICINEFYTVYGVEPSGQSQAVSDHKTKATADELCEFLNGLIEANKPPVAGTHTAREVVEQVMLRWQVSSADLEERGEATGDDELPLESDSIQLEIANDLEELKHFIEAGDIILEEFDQENVV